MDSALYSFGVEGLRVEGFGFELRVWGEKASGFRAQRPGHKAQHHHDYQLGPFPPLTAKRPSIIVTSVSGVFMVVRRSLP